MTFHAAQIYLLLHLSSAAREEGKKSQERNQINLSEASNWMGLEDFLVLSHMIWCGGVEGMWGKFIWEINLFIHSSVPWVANKNRSNDETIQKNDQQLFSVYISITLRHFCPSQYNSTYKTVPSYPKITFFIFLFFISENEMKNLRENNNFHLPSVSLEKKLIIKLQVERKSLNSHQPQPVAINYQAIIFFFKYFFSNLY